MLFSSGAEKKEKEMNNKHPEYKVLCEFADNHFETLEDQFVDLEKLRQHIASCDSCSKKVNEIIKFNKDTWMWNPEQEEMDRELEMKWG